MKKVIAITLSDLMLMACLMACGGKDGMTTSTDGSTSMSKVINALGEALMANNSGVTFTYNATGSSTGIAAVKDGTCDIGLSSHNSHLRTSASELSGVLFPDISKNRLTW